MARPRKHPEGTTAVDRLRASTAARRAAGWIKLDLWLPPEAAADLAAIVAETGETRAEAVARLIRDSRSRCVPETQKAATPKDGG